MTLLPGKKEFTGFTFLIVDDEVDLREVLSETFEMRGARVVTAGNAQEALKFLSGNLPDLIISDIRMVGGDAASLLTAMRSRAVQTPTILISGLLDLRMDEISRMGALAFFAKPFDLPALVKAVRGLLALQP